MATPKRWQVLRMAGLSEERLRVGTDEFLVKVVGMWQLAQYGNGIAFTGNKQ